MESVKQKCNYTYSFIRFFYKILTQFNGEIKIFPTNGVETKGYPYRRYEHCPYLIFHTQN